MITKSSKHKEKRPYRSGRTIEDAPNSKYRQKAEGIVRNKFRDFLDNKADVNTLLRQAEVEIKQEIAGDKTK